MSLFEMLQQQQKVKSWRLSQRTSRTVRVKRRSNSLLLTWKGATVSDAAGRSTAVAADLAKQPVYNVPYCCNLRSRNPTLKRC